MEATFTPGWFPFTREEIFFKSFLILLRCGGKDHPIRVGQSFPPHLGEFSSALGQDKFLPVVIFLPLVPHLHPFDLQVTQQENDDYGYTHYGKVLYPVRFRLLAGPSPYAHDDQVDEQDAGCDINLFHTDLLSFNFF